MIVNSGLTVPVALMPRAILPIAAGTVSYRTVVSLLTDHQMPPDAASSSTAMAMMTRRLVANRGWAGGTLIGRSAEGSGAFGRASLLSVAPVPSCLFISPNLTGQDDWKSSPPVAGHC